MLIAAFTLAQVLSYPFPAALVRDARGSAIAYAIDRQGVRSLWFARAPDFAPKELFSSGGDDGQELSNLVISNDGAHVVYVRGGDHDANWPQPLQPGPASMPQQPDMQVWSVATSGPSTGLRVNSPKLLGDGDAPAISPDGTRVAYTSDGAVMIAPIDGAAAAKRLFFDRGQDSDLHWSPDGSALAFVSTRTDHSFIGIYRNDSTPLAFLAPTTSQDFSPRWSPDGHSVAFLRLHGDGGPPMDPLNWNPVPWEIWVAASDGSSAHLAWASPNTPRGSLPQSGGGPVLEWVSQNRLVFKSEQENWPHLYVVSADGGAARLLTPGAFMVEDVDVAPDLQSVVYSANTGATPGDDDRRHIFRADVSSGTVSQLVSGASSQMGPVALAGGAVAFDGGTAQQPLLVSLLEGGTQRALDANLLPERLSIVATRNAARGQLHRRRWTAHLRPALSAATPAGSIPGIVFVHGGPPRQMLLSWHYMDYYSNAYAVNQYLASSGIRRALGQLPARHRLRSRLQLSGALGTDRRLGVSGRRRRREVSPASPARRSARIGIWGGSYGGYLTALALARNSDIFKAGVDFHGVHDWSLDIDNPVWGFTQLKRFQQYDEKALMKLAWESSPDSAISTWKSPVLLIQGDDDRNVEFHQMVDLVERLRIAHVPYEQIVLPNEIHGFLRYASWLEADTATADYLSRKLSVSR